MKLICLVSKLFYCRIQNHPNKHLGVLGNGCIKLSMVQNLMLHWC